MGADGKRLIKDWIRVARCAGWTVKLRGGHFLFFPPAGQMVSAPGTPGGGRSIQNTRAKLRRAGLNI